LDLLSLYVSEGGRQEEFWSSTPKEIHYFLKGARIRYFRNMKMNSFSDWHIAALTRSKRFPSLAKYLQGVSDMVEGKKTQETRQTTEEIQEIFRSWHDSLKRKSLNG
jgi:hypothetical protein